MTYTEWREWMSDGLRQGQDETFQEMKQTKVLRVYSSNVVPGFLQTPGYVAALLENITEFFGTPNDVDQAVPARTARQGLLHDGEHRFRVVVEEQVLRHRIGDAAVMAEQLRYLLSVLPLPTLSFGIIPLGAVRAVWPLEAFYLYDDRHASVENLTAQIEVINSTEIADYGRAFEELEKAAVYGDAVNALITAALGVLEVA
ncbi:hypothetical protein GCM10010430_59960 [Kitasatospora cystarginea]|uniref:DUF5753 domain-containing protein n=1 Tax=Kitasatospora cystarginea TaxID=58350 RepID=A0ABN3EQD1_9ACTN